MLDKTTTLKNTRSKIDIEIMRIVAIVLVVFCHLPTLESGLGMGLTVPAGWVHAMECTVCRIAVPVFFMISGALLLGRRESIAQVWRHRVLRILLAVFVIWSLQNIYACCFCGAKFGVRTFLTALLNIGPNLQSQTSFATAWFLYAYLFLMIFLPFLRILAQKMRNRHYIYLLVFQVAACCVLPCGYALLFGSFHVMNIPFVAPDNVYYGAFFMLMGYFVEHRCRYSLTKRKVVGRLLAGALVCCILTVLVLCQKDATPLAGRRLWVASASLSALPPIAFYVVVRAMFRRRQMPSMMKGLVAAMGGSVFFVMLTENMWRQQLAPWFPFGDWSLSADVRAWCYACCIVFCAMLAGMLVKHVPGLKRIF